MFAILVPASDATIKIGNIISFLWQLMFLSKDFDEQQNTYDACQRGFDLSWKVESRFCGFK